MELSKFMGDSARPFAIYAIALATAASILKLAWMIEDPAQAAVFIGTVLAGFGALYGVKSWENAKTKGQEAEVAKAEAKAKAAEAVVADPDELPAADRVRA